MPKIKRPEAPAVVRRWKKWMAVGCNHAKMACPHATQAALDFKRHFEPDKTIHIGDIFDATCWRSGAKGTKDESEDVREDIQAGLLFLDRLEPNLVFLGNHDIRPWEQTESNKAIVRMAAEEFVHQVESFIKDDLKAELVDNYDITRSWRMLGDCLIGHGFMFNENAIRDHAEYHGKSCIIAHLHRQGMEQARAALGATGYCIGYLGDPEKFGYANRNRAKSKWTRGWAYGEYTDSDTIVNLYNYEKKCPRNQFQSA